MGTGWRPRLRATPGLPAEAHEADSLPGSRGLSTLSPQSRSSMQQGNVDGARRLGHLARLLSITLILMGIVIITVAVTVNFTGETQLLGEEGASLPGGRTAHGCTQPQGQRWWVGGRRRAGGGPGLILPLQKSDPVPSRDWPSGDGLADLSDTWRVNRWQGCGKCTASESAARSSSLSSDGPGTGPVPD